MSTEEKLKMLNASWELHSQVETSYLKNPANRDDAEWLEKQRLLLADMALHLLQTITDQFLPNADLKKATEKLYCNG